MKQYRVWREKFKAKQRELIKKTEHAEGNPRIKVYTLIEAKKLAEGKFHEDDDDDEDGNEGDALIGQAAKVNKAIYLNRDNLENEMKLEQFEEAIQIVKSGVTDKIDKKNDKLDSIPDEIRKEFNLPPDMKGYEIDFNEIRMKDSSLKRNRFIWSGQDVLEYSLEDKAMSTSVIKYLNQVRVWPKMTFGFIKKARCLLKMFVKSSPFENAMTFCVLGNTIVMAMDKYGNDQATEVTLSFYNEIFTWIFIVEMVLKLLAIGPKKYVQQPMNILDGACVTISVVEIVIGLATESEGGGSLSAFRTVRVFRTFRVLRVARLLAFLRSMAVIVGVITRSLESFLYIMLLLLLFVFIFALLGMQIFGGNYDFGDEIKARTNFDTFWISYVSVF